MYKICFVDEAAEINEETYLKLKERYMSTEMSTIENAELIFEPKHITKETIKKYLCPKASEQELMMGLQIAKTFNLNPLKREVYFVKYRDDQPMQILTGYEVYLKRAERSTKWNGMEVTSEGAVETGNLKAIVKVFRKDWQHPLTHETHYAEYVQKKSDGTINTFWKNKPITMIKKVAVSQAFRLAFPDEFDGMPYTSDEVIDQDKVIDIKIEEPLKMPVPKVLPDSPKPVQDASISKDNEETKDMPNPTPTPNDKLLDNDGLTLMENLRNSKRTKEDLKTFIFKNFGLEKLSEICYKHLDKINEFIKEE